MSMYESTISLLSLSLKKKKKKKKSKVENDLLAYARPVKEIKCSVGYAFLSTDASWQNLPDSMILEKF